MRIESVQLINPVVDKVVDKVMDQGRPHLTSHDSFMSEDSYASDILPEPEPLTPETCHNTTLLAEISTELIAELLKIRAEASLPYTLVGNSNLVNLHTSTNSQYEVPNPENFADKQLFEVCAHPYAVAEHIISKMRYNYRHVCICFMGNSFDGERRAFGEFMNYFLGSLNPNNDDDVHSVILRLDAANKLLERFGSVWTEDSVPCQRFLRTIELMCDVRSSPVGAYISAILLDPYRVSNPSLEQYNVFYVLLRSAPEEYLQKLKLSNEHTYKLFSQTSQTSANMKFSEFLSLFEAVGFNESMVFDIFRVVAAVILLHEVEIEAGVNNYAVVNNASLIEDISELLGVDPAALHRALCFREFKFGANVTEDRLKVEDAKLELQKFIKKLYETLFHWLVGECNDFLQITKTKLQYGKLTSIVILLAPPFENKDENSLEELCMNYVREAVHHSFLNATLKKPQNDYLKDGLEWELVRFEGNKSVLDLIGQQYKGMLAILDEGNVAAGHISDQMFFQAVKTKLSDNKYFLNSNGNTNFRIQHLFGEVSYSVEQFLFKNSLEISDDLTNLLSDAENEVARDCWSDVRPNLMVNKFKTYIRQYVAVDIFKQQKRALGGDKPVNTIAFRLRSFVNEFTKAMEHKDCYFIHSLNPSRNDHLNTEELERQIACLKLSELTALSQASFALSMHFHKFLNRYKMLTQYTWPNFRGRSDVDGIKVLLHIIGVLDDCKFGNHMVHVRTIEAVAQLESMRIMLIPAVVKFLQKMWRGAIARQRYKIFYAMFKIVRKFRAWKFKMYLITLIRRFSGVRELRDFGKSLVWPDPPFILRRFHMKLYNTFRRWRLRQRLKSIPPEDWPEIRVKIAAMDAFGPQVTELGLSRRWKSNYLGSSKEHNQAATYLSVISQILARDNAGDILFSSFVKKINHRGKSVSRALLITDSFIYKFDQKKDFKLLKTIPMSEVVGLSVTPDRDQLVAIHMAEGNDLIICLYDAKLENRLPELVGAMRVSWQLNESNGVTHELKVTVDKSVKCVVNKTPHIIQVEKFSESKPQFRKDHGLKQWTLLWPQIAS